jgi:hypothetical protein
MAFWFWMPTDADGPDKGRMLPILTSFAPAASTDVPVANTIVQARAKTKILSFVSQKVLLFI